MYSCLKLLSRSMNIAIFHHCCNHLDQPGWSDNCIVPRNARQPGIYKHFYLYIASLLCPLPVIPPLCFLYKGVLYHSITIHHKLLYINCYLPTFLGAPTIYTFISWKATYKAPNKVVFLSLTWYTAVKYRGSPTSKSLRPANLNFQITCWHYKLPFIHPRNTFLCELKDEHFELFNSSTL